MMTQIKELITQITNRFHLRNQLFGNLRNHCSNERGALVLSMAILTALLCAITSYAVLQLAIAYARQGRFFVNRTPYRYATEAGIVWAQDRLWAGSGAFCPGAGPDLTVNKVDIEVTISNCGNPAAVHTITAKATY